MKRVSFADGWRVAHLGQNDWQEVTVPHDAMLAEPRTADSPGTTNVGWFSYRDYEYVKDFEAPADAAYLDFEGVYHRAEVFLDGQQMEAHPNGYFGFRVPVTPGKHSLRVIARNEQGPSSRWYSGAGIYRPVTLVCLPKKHILSESICVKTLDDQTRKVSVSFKTTDAGPVTVTINGQVQTGEDEVTFTLSDATLWSPDHPALYTCRLTYGEDTQEVRFGIRRVEVDAKQGFRLNGERVLLLGACIHHENGILGAMEHPFAARRKIALLKKAGYNAIRSAHNPCSRAILEACDELGMLVLDEYVDMWYIHKTAYDYAGLFEQRWREDLPLMVEKDRNHPSVVMYSIGNEVSETAQQKGIALTEQMVQLLHELDDLPVTCGVNIFFNFLSSMGFGVYSDEKAKKEAERAEKQKAAGKKTKKKAVGSEFFNNLSGLMGAGFMKWGATLHGSDVKTRDAFAKMDIAGYNYGAYRYKRDLKLYPDRVILGSETFCSDAVAFYDLAQQNPALIGDFVWTGMDYLGEVGIGAWEYKDYAPRFDKGPGWITAGAGTLDLIGRETSQAAYTQMAFGMSPVRIGVIPVPYARQKHSPAAWRMTNAVESWAWEGCEGGHTTVEVYARGAEAELLLNGVSLGRKKLNARQIAKFNVTWQPGELTAVVYDKTGRETARTSLRSAGETTQLRAEPEQGCVRSDELCYILLRYTDENGMTKPLTRGMIDVRVTGGKLLALGNACSYNERGYLANETDTYYGEALAVVQPDGPGCISVKANSPWGCCGVEVACKEEL